MKRSDPTSDKSSRMSYRAPVLEELGTVAEFTQIGFTNEGSDGVFHAQEGYEGSKDNPNNAGPIIGGG